MNTSPAKAARRFFNPLLSILNCLSCKELQVENARHILCGATTGGRTNKIGQVYRPGNRGQLNRVRLPSRRQTACGDPNMELAQVAGGSALTLFGTALVLGIRHGIDWDHIAAITDIAGTTTSVEVTEAG